MAAPKNEQVGKIIGLYPVQIEVIKDFNPRNAKDYGDIKGLRASIAKDGLIEPIHVSATKRKTEDGWPIYELREGHRRFKAASGIEDFVIPSMVVQGTEAEHMSRALATGIHKKELTMLERAEYVVRLRETYANDGITKKDSELAKELGVSQAHINDLDRLLTADATTLDAVRKGQMSPSQVIELLKQNAPDKVDKQVAKAIAAAEKEGKDKIKTTDIEDVETRSTKKSGSSAPSTKAGIPEESGKPQRLSGNVQATQKLLDLKDAILASDDAYNEVAVVTLSFCIALLQGRMELAEAADIFFGDGTNLPEIPDEELAEMSTEAEEETADEDEDGEQAEATPVVETKPKNKPKAATKVVDEDDLDEKPVTKTKEVGGTTNGRKLKDLLNEVEDKPAGKKAPAKKAAAKPAAATPKAAAPKKAVKPVDEDDEFADDSEELPTGGSGVEDEDDMDFAD